MPDAEQQSPNSLFVLENAKRKTPFFTIKINDEESFTDPKNKIPSTSLPKHVITDYESVTATDMPDSKQQFSNSFFEIGKAERKTPLLTRKIANGEAFTDLENKTPSTSLHMHIIPDYEGVTATGMPNTKHQSSNSFSESTAINVINSDNSSPKESTNTEMTGTTSSFLLITKKINEEEAHTHNKNIDTKDLKAESETISMYKLPVTARAEKAKSNNSVSLQGNTGINQQGTKSLEKVTLSTTDPAKQTSKVSVNTEMAETRTGEKFVTMKMTEEESFTADEKMETRQQNTESNETVNVNKRPATQAVRQETGDSVLKTISTNDNITTIVTKETTVSDSAETDVEDVMNREVVAGEDSLNSSKAIEEYQASIKTTSKVIATSLQTNTNNMDDGEIDQANQYTHIDKLHTTTDNSATTLSTKDSANKEKSETIKTTPVVTQEIHDYPDNTDHVNGQVTNSTQTKGRISEYHDENEMMNKIQSTTLEANSITENGGVTTQSSEEHSRIIIDSTATLSPKDITTTKITETTMNVPLLTMKTLREGYTQSIYQLTPVRNRAN